MKNALGYLGLALQADEGTGAAPVKFVPWQSLSAPENIKMGKYRNGSNRDFAIAAKMGQWSEVQFKTFLYPDLGGALLCWALGATDTVTGTGDPYTHTMPISDNPLGRISAEYAEGNGALIQRAIDGLIDRLGINCVGGQLVEVDCSIKLRQATRQASPATVAFEADRPLSFLDGALTFTGLTIDQGDVTELKMDIQNSLDTHFPVGAFAPRYLEAARVIELSGKVLSPDDVLAREIRWNSGSGTTAASPPKYLTSLLSVFALGGAMNHRIQTTLRNVAMEMGDANWDVNAGAYLISFRGSAIRGGSSMLDAVAVNGVSTAYSTGA